MNAKTPNAYLAGSDAPPRAQQVPRTLGEGVNGSPRAPMQPSQSIHREAPLGYSLPHRFSDKFDL